MILHKAGITLSEVTMFPSDSTKKGKKKSTYSVQKLRIMTQEDSAHMRKYVYKFIFVWWLSSIVVFVVRRLAGEFKLHRRQITVLYFRKVIIINEFLTELSFMNSPLRVSVRSWRSFRSLTNCLWPNWRRAVCAASSTRLYGVSAVAFVSKTLGTVLFTPVRNQAHCQ
jgi:hypothetical protein